MPQKDLLCVDGEVIMMLLIYCFIVIVDEMKREKTIAKCDVSHVFFKHTIQSLVMISKSFN